MIPKANFQPDKIVREICHMKKLLRFATLTTVVLLSTAVSGMCGKTAVNPVYVIKTNHGDIEVELFKSDAPKTVKNFIELAEGKKEFTDPATGKKDKHPFYDGLIFHRVLKDFMIQGGCPLGTGSGGPGYRFEDEIDADALGLDKVRAIDPKKGPHPFLGIRSQRDYHMKILMPLFRSMGIKSQQALDSRKKEVTSRMASLTVKQAYENMGYRYSDKGSGHSPERGSLAMANAGPNTNGSQFFINLVDTPWLAGKHTVFGKVVKGMSVVDKIGAVAVNANGKPAENVIIISIRPKP